MKKIVIILGVIVMAAVINCIWCAFKRSTNNSHVVTNVNSYQNPYSVKQSDFISQPSELTTSNLYLKNINGKIKYVGESILRWDDDTIASEEVIDTPIAFYRDTFEWTGSELAYKRFTGYVIMEHCTFPTVSEYYGFYNIICCRFEGDFYLGLNDLNKPLAFKWDTFISPISLSSDTPVKGYGNSPIFFFNCYFTNGVALNAFGKSDTERTVLDLPTEIQFNDCSIKGVLNLQGNNKIIKISFRKLETDSINFSYVTGHSMVDFSVPRSIKPRAKVAWWNKNKILHFLLSPYLDTISYSKIQINIAGTDINKIDLEYKYFNLYFDSTSNDQKSSIYQSLIDKYQKEGKTESKELVDVDYRNFQGGIVNFFSNWWWNYGYSKGRVFLWALLFLGIFTFINYRYLDYLNRIIYKMEFIPKIKNIPAGTRWWYAFIYTGIIFFSLRIKVENINFNRRREALYLLSIYTIGIVCLAYMANFVLKNA
ncbi:MAG: hypothetical protein JWO06_3790 [Bacteroidota bacterium]|nr:hypothetical protein [Bacteroidota bacterium]